MCTRFDLFAFFSGRVIYISCSCTVSIIGLTSICNQWKKFYACAPVFLIKIYIWLFNSGTVVPPVTSTPSDLFESMPSRFCIRLIQYRTIHLLGLRVKIHQISKVMVLCRDFNKAISILYLKVHKHDNFF
jgi:hypothetical protein